jgi:hypothetical protein
LQARCGIGATAPFRVREQLSELENRIAGFSAWARSQVNGIKG